MEYSIEDRKELDDIFRQTLERFNTADVSYTFTRYGYEQTVLGGNIDQAHPIWRVPHVAYITGFDIDRQLPSSDVPIKRKLSEEVTRSFRHVGQQYVTTVWAVIEQFMANFLRFWVIHFPSSVTGLKEDRELKIDARSLLLPDLHRARFAEKIIGALAPSNPNLPQVHRFSDIVKKVGFPQFELSETTVNTLILLEAARHIIVHNSGMVDARFKLRCPSPEQVPERVGDYLEMTLSRKDNMASEAVIFVEYMATKVRVTYADLARG